VANTLILEGIVGSTAYWLNTATSDEDRLGVYVRPTNEILSIHYSGRQHDSKVEHEPDRTAHEIGKFCGLAIAANPTILELLWLSDYTVVTDVGFNLVSIRNAFLSDRVKKTYGGYALAQAQRLVQRGGTFDPDLTKRTEKHGRHCLRLLRQGRRLLESGQLIVRVAANEREELFAAGKLAASDPEGFLKLFEAEMEKMDTVASRLPSEPDVETVDKFLLNVRHLYMS
jgi:predicted nucleotidyltransferase